jgi:predicted RecB family nuclease
MATKITREILESYLFCKTKAHLKLAGQQGSVSEYEALLLANRQEVRRQATGKLVAMHSDAEVARDVALTTAVLSTGPSFIVQAALEDEPISVGFDGLKRVDGSSRLGGFHYVPMLFHEGRSVGREQKLLLELHGLLLSPLQEKMPSTGIVWHGKECRPTKVRLDADLRKSERLLREVKEMAGAQAAPKLILNDHCQICEFRRRCHDEAVREDNISMLRGMSEKEIRRYARKGIFTVTQLSCTFRLRKRGKRVKRERQPHSFALQAAAIRDKRIYVLKPPSLPARPVRIYLDIEGDSERSFVYLIGMIIDEGGVLTRHSLWADGKDDEERIFRQMLEIVGRHGEFTLFHYGSYETSFLKRMRKALGGDACVTNTLDRSLNLLSIVYSHVYFPLYSNGLKSIGGYLGCTWSDLAASGSKSIVLRDMWEKGREGAHRRYLETYNLEDCEALKRIAELIYRIGGATSNADDVAQIAVGPCPIALAEDLNPNVSRPELKRPTFANPDLDFVNKCAYFGYQHEKVFLRTSEAVRKAQRRKKRRERARKLRINATIEVRSTRCPHCKGTELTRSQGGKHTKLAYDLKVTDTGVKRQVIACTAALHRCKRCKKSFLPPRYKRRDKHFHSLKGWAIYQHMVHRISFVQLEKMFRDCFGLNVNYQEIHMFKILLSKYYRSTYQGILAKILSSGFIHADETHINLQQGKGYVWVFATMSEVAYVYRPTRDGGWVQDLLHGFKGVLISDFFSAYDSVGCDQQKCLIHLIRDMNEDLMINPFDAEYGSFTSAFGSLLRGIIGTVDEHGLQKRHLQKHQKDIDRFYDEMGNRELTSDLSIDYWRRLVKYRDKLFTFMRYDGVSWNNNNAEHAIKPFARYRNITDGQMTEARLRDYLVLLSIYQTCEYRGISFLRFLLSQEKDLDKYRDSGHSRCVKPSLQVYPEGYHSFIRKHNTLSDKPFYPHG